MTTSIKKLEAAALALPRQARASLARRLIESLDHADDVESAWETEVAERVAEYYRGETESVSAEDVFEKARRNCQS